MRQNSIVTGAELSGKQLLGVARDAQFLLVLPEQVIRRGQAGVTPPAEDGNEFHTSAWTLRYCAIGACGRLRRSSAWPI